MKTIVKLLVAVLCACVFTTAHAQYKKVWWDPNQNGMGAFLDQQSNITASGVKQEIIFGAWFHYKTTTDATWLAFSCTLAKDSLGRDGCTDVLFTGNGTPPVGYDSRQLRITTVGTMRIVFNSSASATFDFDYTLPGQARQAGTLNWVPQIFGNVLSYTDKVYAIWTAGYPFATDKSNKTVTKVTNKTSFVNAASEYSYINCWLASKPLSDGKALTSCQETRTGNARKVLYIDPTKNEMYDYAGSVPVDIVWLVTATNADKPEWGAKARVADGWYFTPFNQTSVLNFQPDVGATFAVKAGTFAVDSDLKLLVSYTN